MGGMDPLGVHPKLAAVMDLTLEAIRDPNNSCPRPRKGAEPETGSPAATTAALRDVWGSQSLAEQRVGALLRAMRAVGDSGAHSLVHIGGCGINWGRGERWR